jgi:transposase-like protein
MATKLTETKKAIIGQLIEEYDIKSAKDIQEALKDLLGGTIQEMLEGELDEELGYEKSERMEEEHENYRNGHKGKRLRTSMGEIEINVPQDRNSDD